MRKLFTLLTLCLIAFSASAADIIFDPATDIGTYSGSAGKFYVEKEGIKMEISNGAIGTYQDVVAYRIYKGQTATFTSSIGNITKIEVQSQFKNDTTWSAAGFTADGYTAVPGAYLGTWIGDATPVVLNAQAYQVRARKIIVTVGQAGLAAPSISPASGTYYDPINVTITCPSSGAKIYYTTNGSNPTTSSTQYTGPFTVSSNATVKAISALNGEVSTVVSATYEFATATSVANIAAYSAVADETVVKFNNPVYALAQHNRYLYVKDNSGYALFFGDCGQTYNLGDIIPAGFVGTKVTYSGEPELKDLSNFQASTGNTTINPETITANQVGQNIWAHYVYLENVTIDPDAKILTDANGNTAPIYFSMGVTASQVNANTPYNVWAIVGAYKPSGGETVYQLLPVKVAKYGNSFKFVDMEGTPDDEMVEFTDEIIVVKQGGNGNNYLYAMDANEPRGYGLIYGNVEHTYNPGDVIGAGIGGKKTTYNAEPELAKPFSGFGDPVRTVNIKDYVKTITCSQVGHGTWANYVLLKQVTINTSDQTFTDATGSCPYYNGTFNTPLPSDTSHPYDVYGVVASYGKNNTIYQILPLEFVGGGDPLPPIDVPCIEDLYNLGQGQLGHFVRPLTAIYQNGPSLYVKDDCGTYSLVYGTVEYKDFINGDIIDDAIASWTLYNGAKQLSPTADTFVTTHYVEPVQPEVMPCEELSADMVHWYIRIDDAKIYKEDNNLMVNDGTLPVIMFNKFGLENIPEDNEDHTVWGFLTLYRNMIEIYPIAIDDDPTPPYPRDPEYPIGDVNGDGEVNIADINALIDIILGGVDKSNGRSDCNQDGEVNIADINKVIDIILS